MRYWIWWNDITQGPFELEELVSLRAFSEDLLICMEDRDEWIPASRVADLSPAIEQLKSRRSAPLVPPPPPPQRPPSLTPLQGEFFTEPPEQQFLLDSEDAPKGPFSYRPVQIESESSAIYLSGQAKTPFHFVNQPFAPGPAVEIPPVQMPIVEMPPIEIPRVTFSPQPVITESPVRKEEWTLEDLPKVEPPMIPLELVSEQVPIATPEPVAEPIYQEFEEKPTRRLEWLPWIFGVVFAMGALGSAGYWLMDHANTRSAITEANRMESPKAKPLPPVDLAPVLPAPVESPRVKANHFFQDGVKAAAKTTQKAQKAMKSYSKVPAKVAKTSIKQSQQVAQKMKAMVSHAIPAKTDAKSVAVVAPQAPAAIPAPVPTMAPAPAAPVLPGLAPSRAAQVTAPAASASAPTSLLSDQWKGKQNDAIALVMNKTLPKSKTTIGSQAKALLQQMHEKELIHAAATGERMFLPDKLNWTALQEEGMRYRVYLNFIAWQANGERVQTKSYQFVVDLKRKEVKADDEATKLDIMTQPAELTFKHNPMATDIDSILGGVDTFNKHQVQLIIVKKNKKNKAERVKIDAALISAKQKVMRAVLYFRKTYSEQALQNIAKAYNFSTLLKG